MQRIFTYIFALVLFAACAMNSEIVPGNMSGNVLSFVKRNIEKNRVEIFNDMKEVTKQGLIHFEIYDEAGSLIAILKNPSDFNETIEASFNSSKMLIKSISAVQLSLPSDFTLAY